MSNTKISPPQSIDRGTKKSAPTKGESLTAVYMRRFKKHTLGKIGFFILVFFYSIAFFADFLSTFTMTWTDKTKSYHPPTPIVALYTDHTGKTRFKPFTYEQHIENTAFKKYAIIPEHSLRVVSLEKRPGIPELRICSVEENTVKRKKQILVEISKHFSLVINDPIMVTIEHVLDSIENNPRIDHIHEIHETFINKFNKTVSVDVLLIKGNKNFLSLFSPGIAYTMLGLIPMNTHFFGSKTGGYFALGTDVHGRDVLSRLLHGARISLSVGIVGALISFTIGLLVGGIAGYFGGIIDVLIMRFCEIIIAFPALYLLFALRATFPPTLSSTKVYLLIVIIMSFLSWAYLARIIRGLVLSLKNEEYVLCACSMGLSHMKIIIKHILPNTLSFVIIQATLTIPQFILGESALSFLGLGITDPQSSWGLMLSVARNIRIIQSFPWILAPGFVIFLSIMAWNFFGDGIRDAVDPRSKH